MLYLKLLPILLLIMVVIDAIWIGFVMSSFYKSNLGYIMADKINWGAAILFYVVYIAGLIYFVISPAEKDSNLLKAALGGAVLGFVAYATYDLTNHATLKDWPYIVTIVDMIWGAVLTAFLATLGTFIARFI